MQTIKITTENKEFVKYYADIQNIGGLSNLSKEDLAKSSRLGFQFSGLYGEAAFYTWRYGDTAKLKKLLDFKAETLKPNRYGDGGYDDDIVIDGVRKLIDIKASHVNDINKIKYLNLIIPQREYHKNLIYVAAFVVGNDRFNANEVVLAGWEYSENITKKWSIDPAKYCVPFSDLRDLKELQKFFKNEPTKQINEIL